MDTRRLQAQVRRVTGVTRHVIAGRPMPQPEFVRIEAEVSSHGFLLLYCDASGQSMSDSWHHSIGEAMAQAKREFEIEESEWQEV
jgi:hypothetical protein